MKGQRPQCKPRRGAYVERWADAVSLLVKAPRTRQELLELTGISEGALNRVLYALKGEGLVIRLRQMSTRDGGRGSSPDIWAWSP